MGRALCAAAVMGLAAMPAVGEEKKSDLPEIVQALIGGKPDLFMRLRWENAKVSNGTLSVSNAVTLRTALGYKTGDYHGFKAYGQFENIASPNSNDYFDAIGANTDLQTPVADPSVTEINQAWLEWNTSGLGGDSWLAKSKTRLLGGRREIVLDDWRFIGNVLWRQNWQSFDAATVESKFGLDDMKFIYGYLWEIHRIFGDEGAPGAGTRNFNSNSHILNANYKLADAFNLTGFTYLLDFDRTAAARANSTATYGFRATGAVPFADDWVFKYAGSYAWQNDAYDNPNDYQASYYNVEGLIGYKPLVALKVGYEVLGSDEGRAQFRTPLATAHKFNGWADVFLDNGGAVGLEDIYVGLIPTLPMGFKGALIFHKFDSNTSGVDEVDYGWEIDGEIIKTIWKFTNRLKWAYYDGGNDPGSRPDTYRVWLETTFKF